MSGNVITEFGPISGYRCVLAIEKVLIIKMERATILSFFYWDVSFIITSFGGFCHIYSIPVTFIVTWLVMFLLFRIIHTPFSFLTAVGISLSHPLHLWQLSAATGADGLRNLYNLLSMHCSPGSLGYNSFVDRYYDLLPNLILEQAFRPFHVKKIAMKSRSTFADGWQENTLHRLETITPINLSF